MHTALCSSLRSAPAGLSRLFQCLAVLFLLLAGGTLSAQVITKNVILGGEMDISPFPASFRRR